ncbi:carboxymuconolactone decarboxylase family protein [Guyparkeria sp.]|uniref:carboxymuconolactone decarboxylase family protein n=1 Tax=Guyparkeria sp. TaxID=2035736 RepID=UPI0039705BC3
MSDRYPVHTAETAPQEAADSIEKATAAFGFLPNLIGVMAESPALAEAYLSLSDIFQSKTRLDATEQHVVLLTVSRYHECHYCMAAHTTTAGMMGVDAPMVEAIRNDRPIDDPKLEALRRLTHEMVESRGWPSEATQQRFFDAGYEPSQMFDVLVGIAQKTLSNYTNHLADTPVDEPMQGNAWTPQSA